MIVSNFGIASFGIYFQIPALGFLCRVPKKDCLLSWLERQRPFFTANQNQMTGDCYRFGTWALHSKFRCHHLLTKNVQPWSNPNWRRATPKTQTMSVEKNCGPLSFPPRWIILWHPGTAWETPRTLAPKTNGWGLKITFFKGRREKKHLPNLHLWGSMLVFGYLNISRYCIKKGHSWFHQVRENIPVLKQMGCLPGENHEEGASDLIQSQTQGPVGNFLITGHSYHHWPLTETTSLRTQYPLKKFYPSSRRQANAFHKQVVVQ